MPSYFPQKCGIFFQINGIVKEVMFADLSDSADDSDSIN